MALIKDNSKVSIKYLDRVLEITVKKSGAIISIDLSDKEIATSLVGLIVKYQEAGDGLALLNKSVDEASSIKDGDYAALYQVALKENEFLRVFKQDVDDIFKCDITDKYYGKILPGLDRYTELFSLIVPYMEQAKKDEYSAIYAISDMYTDKASSERVDE